MSQWAVITGGSTGIGAAVLRRLVSHEPNLHCLAVGRRLPQLEEARKQALAGADDANGGKVHVVSADVSTPEGIAAIVSALPVDASVKYLVHNAGTLGPIAPLMEMDRSTWRQVVGVNLDAPLFLTQALLPHLKRCAADSSGTKARVLNVSSGAAHGAYVGWGSYCVTKSALHMMYRVLSAELSPHGILVGSVRPGVVDTPMQDGIREWDGPAEHFPMANKFHDLHEDDQLEDPDEVATFFTGCCQMWTTRSSALRKRIIAVARRMRDGRSIAVCNDIGGTAALFFNDTDLI